MKVEELNISKGEILLGAPKSYWGDLNAYNPVTSKIYFILISIISLWQCPALVRPLPQICSYPVM
jgi:hypothetical protein